MFIIRKIFKSKKSNKLNEVSSGCVESDALPVVEVANNRCEEDIHHLQRRNIDTPPEVSGSLGANTDSTNVNVNQQVVVQFSNINGLQIGSTYNINKTNNINNVNGEKVKNNFKTKYPKTNTIVEMMKCKDEPSGQILNEISAHLGSDYKSFMRELGFSEGQISAKNIDHSIYGVKEVIYQLLLDWMRNADEDATVGYLITKLWNLGYRECVYRLKCIWKSKDYEKSHMRSTEEQDKKN